MLYVKRTRYSAVLAAMSFQTSTQKKSKKKIIETDYHVQIVIKGILFFFMFLKALRISSTVWLIKGKFNSSAIAA